VYGLSNGTITNDFSEGESHLCCLDLCNIHNSGNTPCFKLTTACLHINWKAHAACDLKFIVKGEGLLLVTDNHVHWKSRNRPISKTVLDRDCNNKPLTGNDTCVYGLSNSSNRDDVECP